MSTLLGKIGWMDSTDFADELGHALGGVTVYPDEEDCKENNVCIDERDPYPCTTKRVIVFDADAYDADCLARAVQAEPAPQPVGVMQDNGEVEWYTSVEPNTFLFTHRWTADQIAEGERRAQELKRNLAEPVGKLSPGQEILIRAKVIDPAVKSFHRTVEIEFPHGGTRPTYVDSRDVIANTFNARLAGAGQGEISDGYHTFNELYEHRHALFSIICAEHDGWKSMLHEDGTMFNGWFIAGVMTPKGMATYHLPLDWWPNFKAHIVARAPKWDGHTAQQVPKRIASLAARAGDADFHANIVSREREDARRLALEEAAQVIEASQFLSLTDVRPRLAAAIRALN